MSFRNCRIVASNVDPEKYHAEPIDEGNKIIRRGDPGFPVSSSTLRDFADCPRAWRDGKMTSESKAMRYGSLLDCLALTPDQFADRYVIVPETYDSDVMECPRCGTQTDSKVCRSCKCERVPKTIQKDWNWLSQTCQDWRTKQFRKICVSDSPSEDGKPSMLMECRAAAAKLRADAVAGPWGECSEKQVWIIGEWYEKATELIIPVRCLIDYVPKTESVYGACAGDLKSIRSVMLSEWESDMATRGYYIQAAWNLDMLISTTEQVNEDGFNARSQFCFILSENSFPYQVARRFVDPETIRFGRAEYREMMANYALCLQNNRWPGPDDTTDSHADGWSNSKLPQWFLNKKSFAPKFKFLPDAEKTTESIPSDMPS